MYISTPVHELDKPICTLESTVYMELTSCLLILVGAATDHLWQHSIGCTLSGQNSFMF